MKLWRECHSLAYEEAHMLASANEIDGMATVRLYRAAVKQARASERAAFSEKAAAKTKCDYCEGGLPTAVLCVACIKKAEREALSDGYKKGQAELIEKLNDDLCLEFSKCKRCERDYKVCNCPISEPYMQLAQFQWAIKKASESLGESDPSRACLLVDERTKPETPVKHTWQINEYGEEKVSIPISELKRMAFLKRQENVKPENLCECGHDEAWHNKEQGNICKAGRGEHFNALSQLCGCKQFKPEKPKKK